MPFMSKSKESTFEEEVEQTNEICSNCYRRIKFTIEPPDRIPNFVADVQEYQPHSDEVWVEETRDGDLNGSPNVKRTACECGCVSPYTKVDRPVENFQIYAERIIERLVEEGVDFDEALFVEEVHELKTQPEYQHKDEAVFEDALETSL